MTVCGQCGRPIGEVVYRCWDCDVPYHRECAKRSPCSVRLSDIAKLGDATFLLAISVNHGSCAGRVNNVLGFADLEAARAEARRISGCELTWADELATGSTRATSGVIDYTIFARRAEVRP